MKAVLLIDFGSTYTKITAVDVEEEKILGTAQSFTTIETDINDGLNNALAILKEQIGEIEFSERYACSSAAGGLRMVAIGLVPELTAKAAPGFAGRGSQGHQDLLLRADRRGPAGDRSDQPRYLPADRRHRRRQQGKYRL